MKTPKYQFYGITVIAKKICTEKHGKVFHRLFSAFRGKAE